MKEKTNNLRNNIIYCILIAIIILSSIYIAKYLAIQKEAKEESELLNDIDIMKNNIESNKNEKAIAISEETERMTKIKKLQEENSDIVGWIEIEGTNINYPVLQGKDNEYYLTHNYKKEKSEKGSIFLNTDYDLKLPSDNLLIYGHNLVSGQMFNNLLKYKDKEFCERYPNIRFTTEKEDFKFEIFSAFYSKVFGKSEENVFRYYNFVTAKSEKDYNNFIENAKKASLYDTDIDAKYGDRLITLVTCSYHVEDGRFVVIGAARK